MKTKIVILAAILALATIASAQTNSLNIGMQKPVEDHHFGIGVEPHWLLIGGFGLKADGRVADTVALEVGGWYVPPRRNSGTASDDDNKSYRYETDYMWSVYEVFIGTRFMLTGNYDHSGIFATPGVGYTGAKITEYSSSNLSAALDAPELRLTMGYQFVFKDFRFLTGAGWRLIGSNDVVVKDASGREVYTQKSSNLGGLVLDLHAAYLF